MIHDQIRHRLMPVEGPGSTGALILDTAPREVEVPADLAAALAGDEPAWTAFERLSYTHRKEHVRFIEEAKREQTRRRRIDRTLESLRPGHA